MTEKNTGKMKLFSSFISISCFAPSCTIQFFVLAQSSVAAPTTTSESGTPDPAFYEKRSKARQLMQACWRGDIAKVTELTNAGADVHAHYEDVDRQDFSCAHLATEARLGQYMDVLRKLYSLGAPMDRISEAQYQRTPLYYAVRNDDTQAFDLLLPLTKKFSGHNHRGQDIVYLACTVNKNDSMCAKLKAAGHHMGQLSAEILNNPHRRDLDGMRKHANVPDQVQSTEL